MENNTQLLNLGEAEMLALYKRLLHLEDTRRDCLVEREDGIDLDALLLTRLKVWYSQLLATAPVEWLPTEDFKTEVTLTANADGIISATVPARAVRPVEWRLEGWKQSVTTFLEPDDNRARFQHLPLLRGGECAPAIIDYGTHLNLYSATTRPPQLATARCVAIPENKRYIFHPAALKSLEEESVG